ncbi:hypothetical protein [Planobispora takensis]|uniref:Uncharacterized protein n=1 Tax=Planobispora takensis TaxID=1367882 RepID=A0A8J3T9J1_9ACTN|nr:hypothetical protein [Planobispora takensis]GII03394.1 hypothetical protein Pta02_54020 [Planobispora takensis]
MNPTRKLWVSAGVVAVVLIGGVSVSAAASAGGLERAGKPTPATEPNLPASEETPPPAPSTAPGKTSPPEDYVVSREVNPDPESVTRYWTEHRMEGAEPMPMPQVEGPVDVTE